MRKAQVAGDAGIGGGGCTDGYSTVENLVIVGENINATGDVFLDGTRAEYGAAIGPGFVEGEGVSSLKQLHFIGEANLVLQSVEVSAIKATQMLIQGASITARTNTSQLFVSTPQIGDPIQWSFLYTTTSPSAVEPISDLPSIEIGNIIFPEVDL
jgi:hypothetical protein